MNKYLKFLLIGILLIFLVKSIDINSNNNLNIDKEICDKNPQNININVENVNLNIVYSNVDTINVISTLSNIQKEKYKYNIINNSANNTLEINQYHLAPNLDSLNSYGTLELIIPQKLQFSGINIYIKNGIITSNVDSDNFEIHANSAKTNITGKIKHLNLAQNIGSIVLNQINNETLNVFNQRGVIALRAINTNQLDIKGTNNTDIKIEDICASYVNLNDKLGTITFDNMKPYNYKIENTKIKKTNLTYQNNQYIYTLPDTNSMNVNAHQNVIKKFIINDKG